jgi:hypothetical protein
MQFTTCAIIITPLNYIWQQNLEATLPGKTPAKAAPKHEEKPARPKSKTSEPSLNVTNTITKIVIDQTIGGTWNTVLFILTMGLLRGQHHELVIAQIREVSLILLCQLGPDFFMPHQGVHIWGHGPQGRWDSKIYVATRVQGPDLPGWTLSIPSIEWCQSVQSFINSS